MSHAPQKIYLASKSPRRRELLRQANIDFELLLLREDVARGADVTEIALPNESPEAYVARVTQAKALAAWHVVLAMPAHGSKNSSRQLMRRGLSPQRQATQSSQ